MTVTSVNRNSSVIEFCVFDPSTEICGYTWRIESHATSFYIKSVLAPFQLAKVSLHGPDPGHDAPHNRFDLIRDESRELATKVVRKAVRAGGGLSAESDELPFFFTGRLISHRARHLIRFCTDGILFRNGMPSCPPPPRKEGVAFRVIPAPPRYNVVHVDIYVSKGWAYFPGGEKRLRREQRLLGQLENEAGMHLTAVAEAKPPSRDPDPFGDLAGNAHLDSCFRDLRFAVDDSGELLWICEKLVPLTHRILGGVVELPGANLPGPGFNLPGVGQFLLPPEPT